MNNLTNKHQQFVLDNFEIIYNICKGKELENQLTPEHKKLLKTFDNLNNKQVLQLKKRDLKKLEEIAFSIN